MNEGGARLIQRRLLAVGAGLAALYIVILTGQRALEAYRANQEIEGTRQEITALRAKNIELQKQLASSELDDRDIERTAREELGLARPGDHPVILVWPDGDRPSAPAQPTERSAVEPTWHQWLRLFVDSTSP